MNDIFLVSYRLTSLLSSKICLLCCCFGWQISSANHMLLLFFQLDNAMIYRLCRKSWLKWVKSIRVCRVNIWSTFKGSWSPQKSLSLWKHCLVCYTKIPKNTGTSFSKIPVSVFESNSGIPVFSGIPQGPGNGWSKNSGPDWKLYHRPPFVWCSKNMSFFISYNQCLFNFGQFEVICMWPAGQEEGTTFVEVKLLQVEHLKGQGGKQHSRSKW